MNKQTRSFLSFYQKAVVVFPILGLGTGICYFLAMRNDFDPAIGHFAKGSPTAVTAAVLTALSILCAAVLAIASRKAVSVIRVPKKNPLTASSAVMGSMAAVGMLIFFAVRIFDPVLGFAPGFGKLAFAAELCVIFLPPALLLSLFPSYDVSDVRAFFWLMSVGAILLSLFACYFNYDIPLNSPVRNYTVLMQAAILLLLLAEARLALDPNAPRSYVAAPFQIFACAVSSSVGFGLSLGGLLDALWNGSAELSANPNLPMLRLLLYFGLGLFGASRLFAFPGIAGDYREKPAETKAAKSS